MNQRKILAFLTFITALALLASACGTGSPAVQRTAIPTLARGTFPPPGFSALAARQKSGCQIQAVDLIGAWVSAGSPADTQPFDFTDVAGKTCQGTFAEDVQPLFVQSNLWFDGSLACATCHGPDLASSFVNMNLSTREGILAGEGRSTPNAKGSDILAGGNWDKSKLKTILVTRQMPLGRPSTSPEKGPLVEAGTPK